MKATYMKILSLLMALLTALSLLVSCNDTTDELTESNGNETIAATEGETESPLLDEAAAKALLTAAITATEAKTAYANTIHSTMSTEGISMMDVEMYKAVDEKGYATKMSAMGMTASYVILSDKAYVALGMGDTYSEKYAVTLTAEQKDTLLSTVVSGAAQDGLDLSFMTSADVFVGLSGEKKADGSAVLTATDLTADAKATMDDGDGSTVAVKTCVLTVSPDGLLTGMELAVTVNIPETDYTAAMSIDMSLTQTGAYENVAVTAPEDADTYLAESYAAVFEGTEPMNWLLTAAGMPVDGDNFVIDTTANKDATAAQGQLLSQFPQLYADKNFTITTTVTAEDSYFHVALGDTSVFMDYSENVLGPMEGDVIRINAQLQKALNGEESDLSNYCFYFESYEVVERAKGPNGGTYMFVAVSASSSLNVRSVPSSSGNTPITALMRGDVVEVLAIADGWAKIAFEKAENGYAYVSADYLSES